MNTNLNEMNAELLKNCEEAAGRFPDMDPKLIGRMVKFAMVAGIALRESNRVLAAKGKVLSEKGVEFVLREAHKLAAGG